MSLSVVIAIIAVLAGAFFFLKSKQDEEPVRKEPAPEKDRRKKKKKKQHKVDITAKFKHNPAKKKQKRKEEEIKHQCMERALRGHNEEICDFDVTGQSGSLAASCSKDGTLRIWKLKPVKPNPPYARLEVTRDHCTAVSLSNHGHYCAAVTAGTKQLQVYQVTSKGDDGRPHAELKLESDTKHKDEVSVCLWGPHNSFIATASTSQDTSVKFWNPRDGSLLKKIDSKQLVNYAAVMSPCGNFFTIGSRLAEVKIWRLLYSNGSFLDAEVCMVLKGGKKGVLSLCFSADSKQIVTGSLDGTWRLWNIDVRYQMNEDPKILHTQETDFKEIHHVALPPGLTEEGQVKRTDLMALAAGTTIQFVNPNTGEVISTIENAHREFINELKFTPDGSFLTSCGGDKNVKFWKLPC